MREHPQTKVDQLISSEDGEVDKVNLFLQIATNAYHGRKKTPRMTWKIGQESNRTSALDNKARPIHEQDATPTLLPVRINAKINKDGKNANKDDLYRRISFLFSSIVPKIIRSERKPKLSSVLIDV